MRLYSTNRKAAEVSLKEAIFRGLPEDNGLYMPTVIPRLPDSFFREIDRLSFQEIALNVTQSLIGEDIPEKDLKKIIQDVFTFDAPVQPVLGNIYVLELFHGPSLAFKDFGARFMARIMAYFLSQDNNKEITILVATSGDTGSAVAQGFLNMPGIQVVILYPSGKVSEIQEKQLTTLGNNITALEVKGTFDDCQRMVKEAFLDSDLNQRIHLSSANSINISRLIPQSLYYFYAFAQLKKQGNLPVVFSTPSGNFGNLCGGLIAKKMGLPVEKFIAATNINDIVPEYLRSGLFTPRPSIRTISNAMDVGNPSNFNRIIEFYDKDLGKIKADIVGKSYTDIQTQDTIKEVYEKTGYVLDPHGAVAFLGLKEYLLESGSEAYGVFLATAHPAKFPEIVEEVIKRKIELPENLRKVALMHKRSIVIDPDFQYLKNFLLA